MCTSPRSVQFNPDGTLNFRKRYYNPAMVPMRVPCGKCIECLLERARDWSIRCVHEASMHEQNSFITLTYSDNSLPKDKKLNHTHFQAFMKSLRKNYGEGIGFFMCGEYGEQTARPHYHACLFGVDFEDKKPVRQNKHGDMIWNSETLTKLWGLGHTELGSVTQKSAGYVARYVMKKQGDGASKAYQKMSRKNAIGKSYLEKFYKNIFINGRGSIILIDGTKTKVPRYYEKWFLKNYPEKWKHYVTKIKPENTERLQGKAEREHAIYLKETIARKFDGHSYQTPLARKREILRSKIKELKRNYL